MNRVMESIFEQSTGLKDVVQQRASNSPPELVPVHDTFTAYLHEEMRQCYLNGLDHAAILMACSLIEYCIKHAVYLDHFLKSNRVFDPEKWNEIDGMDLDKVIKYAKSLTVITKDGWKKIDSFRETVRNYYMHGATPGHIKELKIPVHVGDLEKGEARLEDVEVGKDISIQRIVRIVTDRRLCESAVRFADKVARGGAIFEAGAMQEYESKNPVPKPTKQQFDKVMEEMKKSGFSGGLGITQSFPDDA